MNAESGLTARLRANVLRLWREAAAPGGVALNPAAAARLTELAAQLLTSTADLGVWENSPESKLVRGLLPAGLPLAREARELAAALQRPLAVSAVEHGLIGESPRLRDALGLATQLAVTSAPVLILGETGSGKELLARYVHARSLLAGRLFVTTNCAAISEQLLLSALFGYEPGAFTGASPRGQVGKLEAADGGTLFLDEVGDLPLAAQAALLRFLDGGEIQKIGRVQPLRVNVRLICATNQDLEAAVRAGRFRADLFYRMGLLPITMPPLRDRLSDLPLLCADILVQLQRVHRRELPNHISEPALAMLHAHRWPGNVRELRFALERAFLVCGGARIEAADLPGFRPGPAAQATAPEREELMARLRAARPGLFRDPARWANLLWTWRDRELSNADLTAEFGFSESAARMRLAALVQLGVLAASGSKRGRRYRVQL